MAWRNTTIVDGLLRVDWERHKDSILALNKGTARQREAKKKWLGTARAPHGASRWRHAAQCSSGAIHCSPTSSLPPSWTILKAHVNALSGYGSLMLLPTRMRRAKRGRSSIAIVLPGVAPAFIIVQ